MEIKKMKLADIKPSSYNPRKDLEPGDPEYESLKRSIEEFDCVQLLVWNKRTENLVSGHQTLKILKGMGVREFEVSIVDLSVKKEKALNLALNKIKGDWDKFKLADVLSELDSEGLEVTGFSEDEIEEILDSICQEPEEKELKYIKRIHILISTPVDSFIEIKELLEEIRRCPGVEYEQGYN